MNKNKNFSQALGFDFLRNVYGSDSDSDLVFDFSYSIN